MGSGRSSSYSYLLLLQVDLARSSEAEAAGDGVVKTSGGQHNTRTRDSGAGMAIHP